MRNLVYAFVVTLFSAAPLANAQSCDTGGCDSHQACCPACNYVCKFTVEKEKVGESCFEVKCEPICIPKVRLPWEKLFGYTCDTCGCGNSGCDGGCDSGGGCDNGNCGCGCNPCKYGPRCGKVKVVKKLVKVEWECERCKCKFTPVCIGSCCGAGCDIGCDNGCEGSCDEGHTPVPATPEVDRNVQRPVPSPVPFSSNYYSLDTNSNMTPSRLSTQQVIVRQAQISSTITR